MRAAISAAGRRRCGASVCLPGPSWSSRWIAAAPACSKACTVRQMFAASWKPPSASAITGTCTALAIERTCSTSSGSASRPVSGRAKRLAAVA